MGDSQAENNKAIVLDAFETLFNKRDYAAAERFWSSKYIQHSAHIAPGRDGLFNLIKSVPPTLKYEPGVIVAEGDFVIIHGRFSGIGLPANWPSRSNKQIFYGKQESLLAPKEPKMPYQAKKQCIA
jgi:SnoaL-like domain